MGKTMAYGTRRAVLLAHNQLQVCIHEAVQVIVTTNGSSNYTVSLAAGKDITAQISQKAKVQIEQAIAARFPA